MFFKRISGCRRLPTRSTAKDVWSVWSVRVRYLARADPLRISAAHDPTARGSPHGRDPVEYKHAFRSLAAFFLSALLPPPALNSALCESFRAVTWTRHAFISLDLLQSVLRSTSSTTCRTRTAAGVLAGIGISATQTIPCRRNYSAGQFLRLFTQVTLRVILRFSLLYKNALRVQKKSL